MTMIFFHLSFVLPFIKFRYMTYSRNSTLLVRSRDLGTLRASGNRVSLDMYEHLVLPWGISPPVTPFPESRQISTLDEMEKSGGTASINSHWRAASPDMVGTAQEKVIHKGFARIPGRSREEWIEKRSASAILLVKKSARRQIGTRLLELPIHRMPRASVPEFIVTRAQGCTGGIDFPAIVPGEHFLARPAVEQDYRIAVHFDRSPAIVDWIFSASLTISVGGDENPSRFPKSAHLIGPLLSHPERTRRELDASSTRSRPRQEPVAPYTFVFSLHFGTYRDPVLLLKDGDIVKAAPNALSSAGQLCITRQAFEGAGQASASAGDQTRQQDDSGHGRGRGRGNQGRDDRMDEKPGKGGEAPSRLAEHNMIPGQI
ncbi:hypothetical protein JHW43_008796 [Diplocarpon mali]|nr:hypothetical protein JHW43_008796 [Diplocarpon mali]